MQNPESQTSLKFKDIVSTISDIGKAWHTNTLLQNAQRNSEFIHKTIRDLDDPNRLKKSSAIIISAGPSLHRFNIIRKIKEADYQGTTVAVDGSLIKCLKNGWVPDYVLTLDPHPTRMVRWFGDYDFETNSEKDNYFSRQDLDVDFRNNSIRENLKNIELVNSHGKKIKLIIATSTPTNVVQRASDAGMDLYWWNPLVDDPSQPESLTRKLYDINKIPSFNTGGTVGSAAWVFANAILRIPKIAVTGMDLGYFSDLPLEMTQSYYELHEFINSPEELKQLFPEFTFPLTGEKFYTDPTYYWYRTNLLEMLAQGYGETYNCSGGGTLFGDEIKCLPLDNFLLSNGKNPVH